MNTDWIKAALVRAVKTFAQSAVALITANATGLLDVDWQAVASVAGLAAVVSILTSLGGLPESGGPGGGGELYVADVGPEYRPDDLFGAIAVAARLGISVSSATTAAEVYEIIDAHQRGE